MVVEVVVVIMEEGVAGGTRVKDGRPARLFTARPNPILGPADECPNL